MRVMRDFCWWVALFLFARYFICLNPTPSSVEEQNLLLNEAVQQISCYWSYMQPRQAELSSHNIHLLLYIHTTNGNSVGKKNDNPPFLNPTKPA
jgi:hypothetical protein